MWETCSHKLTDSSDFPSQSKRGSHGLGPCGSPSWAVTCALQCDEFCMSIPSRWPAEESGCPYVQVTMDLVVNELRNAEYSLKLMLFMVLIVATFNSQSYKIYPAHHQCFWSVSCLTVESSSVRSHGAPDIVMLSYGFTQVRGLAVCVSGCGPAPESNQTDLSRDMASSYTLPYMTNKSGLYNSWADWSHPSATLADSLVRKRTWFWAEQCNRV